MKKLVTSALAQSLVLLPCLAHADFLADSKANLELRNFYYNKDFRQAGASQSKSEEWAQGFLLRYESGYTQGDIGMGVDAIGLLGLKLDSSPNRSASGLLPYSSRTGRAADDYSNLGVTAKLRVSKSTLKIGTLLPKLPVVQYNDTRLLPQTFQGGLLEVNEFDGLALQAGQLRQVKQRDSTNEQDLAITQGSKKNISLGRHTSSDRFNLVGGNYRWSDSLSTNYHYASLQDIYRQHFLGLVHQWPLARGQSLKSDLRWARSTDEGGSNVDNTALSALFTYRLGNQAFALGYQRMSGDTGFAYLSGTDPYLVNYVQIGDFANKGEHSWQARYDFTFASFGLPGLSLMTRYLQGEHIDLLTDGSHGNEWERDTDIGYVVQSGALKNLGLKLRNSTYRSSFGNDLDETRLILSYSLPLW
ncbi:outer membrane porin, OprD family [Pseudomonas aeruginosa]|uniref:OprD family porin n=1 Tax=Pseudomonas aeruginosa TaxID=287 RepID=UPI000F531318|nr:OprD family porin [Pseudomonas aeruginosa]MCO2075320.1 outer membrane porin, OprD family [Pseudomonas aeruginosa]RQF50371.1 outer membrane porin, OprD family [Pseudomonas aeruginosa]